MPKKSQYSEGSRKQRRANLKSIFEWIAARPSSQRKSQLDAFRKNKSAYDDDMCDSLEMYITCLNNKTKEDGNLSIAKRGELAEEYIEELLDIWDMMDKTAPVSAS